MEMDPQTNFSLHRTMIGDEHLLHIVGVIHFSDLLKKESKEDIKVLLDIIKKYNGKNAIEC